MENKTIGPYHDNKVTYPYHDSETKIVWAKSIKVGDTICNCNFKHLKVIEMLPCCEQEEQRNDCDCNIYDMKVTLEDGSWCNLMYCADAIPHPEEWHGEGSGEGSGEGTIDKHPYESL